MGVMTYLYQRIVSCEHLPVSAEWIEELSANQYPPMLRLLDAGHVKFQRSQAGCTPAMAARLKSERIRVFRTHLDDLEKDFNRICCLLKLVLSQSDWERPELSRALLLNQMTFGFRMARARVRLALYGWGICSVDVTELVRLFDRVRVDALALVTAATKLGSPG